MKIWLDDERPCPNGWVSTRWPHEVIAHLQTGKVREISLDHDLGNDDVGTGYGVILWIEEAVVVGNFRPPKITVHSANPAAKRKMELGVASIYRHFHTKHPLENVWSLAAKMLRRRNG